MKIEASLSKPTEDLPPQPVSLNDENGLLDENGRKQPICDENDLKNVLFTYKTHF